MICFSFDAQVKILLLRIVEVKQWKWTFAGYIHLSIKLIIFYFHLNIKLIIFYCMYLYKYPILTPVQICKYSTVR